MQPESLPYSVEAEMSVLGGMLISSDAIPRAADLVEPQDFYRQAHRILFETILDLHEERLAVEPVTLSERLRTRNQFRAVGEARYLAQLWDYTPSAANLEHHARIVREKAQLRRYQQIGADLEAMVKDGKSAAEVQETAERLIFAAAQRSATEAPLVPIKVALRETMEKLESGEADVQTGFVDVDRLAGGFPRGDLVVLAARPSMGKTALGLQWAVNVAATNLDGHGRPRVGEGAVAVFSLEMSRGAITRRMLFTEARVDSTKFRRAPADDDYPRLAQAAAFLNSLPLFIQDRVRTPRDIRTHCRRLKLEKGRLGAVVVDYLGKLRGTRETENRVHELGEITGDLKALAVELEVPVVALAQLSRAVEQRPDKRPVMSDLRDSGEIEQDADSILFLYRPEYYYGPTDKEGNSLEGLAELILAKQRNGATGTVDLHFHKEFTRFENRSARGER